jgi:hypothetical protein
MGKSIRDLKSLLETVLRYEPDESSHHIRYTLKVNGRIVAQTHISHSRRGNERVDDSMLLLHAREMRCSLGTLKSLLQGQKLKEDYFRELLQKGHINEEEYGLLCKKGNTTKKG